MISVLRDITDSQMEDVLHVVAYLREVWVLIVMRSVVVLSVRRMLRGRNATHVNPVLPTYRLTTLSVVVEVREFR